MGKPVSQIVIGIRVSSTSVAEAADQKVVGGVEFEEIGSLFDRQWLVGEQVLMGTVEITGLGSCR